MQSEKREAQENRDVKERDNMYVVEIELPEYAHEDIRALFNDGYLVVTAKKAESGQNAETSAEKSGHSESVDVEVTEGKKSSAVQEFKKAYYIGRNVSQDNIRAAFHNGVLKCMITKVEKGNADGPVEIEIM